MAQTVTIDLKWHGPQVIQTLRKQLRSRMTKATSDLHAKIKKAISIDVIWDAAGNVIQRSKPGEYPRRETQKLWNTLFFEIDDIGNDVIDGLVATPVDYGLYLETRKSKGKRTYLTRGLWESIPDIKKTLLGQEITE